MLIQPGLALVWAETGAIDVKDALYHQFVVKAQEAEENADKATDAEIRRAWRKVADGYLQLANAHLRSTG